MKQNETKKPPTISIFCDIWYEMQTDTVPLWLWGKLM